MELIKTHLFMFDQVVFLSLDERGSPQLIQARVCCRRCENAWMAKASGKGAFYPNFGTYLFDCPRCRAIASVEPELLFQAGVSAHLPVPTQSRSARQRGQFGVVL